MSYKVSLFTVANPQPKTLCKFAVWIPGILESPIIVSAADFPFEVFQEAALWINGQPVYLPTRTQVPGEWRCTLEEDVEMSTIQQLKVFKNNTQIYSGNTLVLRPKNISIFILDEYTSAIPVNSCILKSAWLKAIEPINLEYSKVTEPLKWRLSFRYSYIETYSDKVTLSDLKNLPR